MKPNLATQPKTDFPKRAVAQRAIARRVARENAGFTLEKLARRVGRAASTLRRIEREGRASEPLAHALSAAVGCKKELFL